jgi:hypothetical protein
VPTDKDAVSADELLARDGEEQKLLSCECTRTSKPVSALQLVDTWNGFQRERERERGRGVKCKIVKTLMYT